MGEMRLPMKPHDFPSRVASGLYILHSGSTKLRRDEELAKHVQGMASSAYPSVEDVDPVVFTRALGAAECALGAALVTPLVSSRTAGVGLGAYSAGLLGLYVRLPGMRVHGSLRPSPDGAALAKDVWLMGIALSLMMERRHRAGRRPTGRRPTGRRRAQSGRLAA
jgi:hypothetical protein